MKKDEFLADGVRQNEMSYLVNKEGKRVNYKGEELIEIDAEAYMRAIESKVYFGVSVVLTAVLGLGLLLTKNESSIGFHYDPTLVFLFIFFMLSSLVFFVVSKWKHKTYKPPKFVVNLPKETIKSLQKSDTILGDIFYGNANLDKDGDGRILVSEVYPLSEEEVLENICKVDSDFSILDFKDYVKSVFTLVQDGWSNNDYRSLRPYETDLLYVRHKARIESMIAAEITNKRSNVRVKGALLKDYKIEDDREVLVVALTAKMKVENTENMFLTDDGDFPYVLKFVRKKGVKNNKNKNLSTGNCCNCGAVIDVDDKGICRYCETSVVSGENDWVLADIKNIKIQGM